MARKIISKSAKASQKAHSSRKAAKAVKAAPKANAAQKANQTPYRPGSNYQAIVDVLSAHNGKPIDFKALKAEVKAAMGENWSAFAKREGRNENAKDTDGRLHQNVCVLQRKADYARPLTAMKLEVVKTKDDKRGWLYSLVKIGK